MATRTRGPDSRLTPRDRGQQAEAAVADYLYASGFDVLARNTRVGALELDVVGRRGSLVVVVEVRARRPGALVGPFASIGRTKRERLVRAARGLWVRCFARDPGVQRLRIDAAAVAFEGSRTTIDYAEGAISG